MCVLAIWGCVLIFILLSVTIKNILPNIFLNLEQREGIHNSHVNTLTLVSVQSPQMKSIQ